MMNRICYLHLLFLLSLALLVGCRQPTAVPVTPTTAPPTETALRPRATVTSAPTPPTAVAGDLPTSAAPTPPTAVAADLPAPTLFDIAWDDRSLFRPGLIPAAQDVLQQLPGATVYLLDVYLDESLTAVSGVQEIRYTNQENVPLDQVVFHLFPNLLGGDITVQDVTVNGRAVTPILQTANSIMRVPLPAPLLPGAAVVIRCTFTTLIPTDSQRNYNVFAYQEDILALAHFYPLVAVYDTAGWRADPPAPQGDVTYSDTSFYLVRITAPDDLVIAASGYEVMGSDGGRVFAAGPMRDFYLAASHDYITLSRQVGDVTINSFAPARYTEGATAVLDFAAAALTSFSDRFTPYPFTELDVVSTPTLALGIEYPGIIVNALRIYDLDASSGGLPNRVRLESTTAHEVGHQWFYSLVGSDQLREPWLDEAVTQYVTYLYYLDTGGPPAAQMFYNALEGYWDVVDMADIAIGLPVAAYNNNEYGGIVYGRGPIFIHQLAATMGQETFDAFLRAYVHQFQWNIATGADFQNLAEQTCACDLAGLFTTWVFPGNE